MEHSLENHSNQMLPLKEVSNGFYENSDMDDIDEFCWPYSSPYNQPGSSSMDTGMVSGDQSLEEMGLITRYDSSSYVNSPPMELAPPSNISTLPSEDECVALDDAVDDDNDMDVHHKEMRIDVKYRLHKKIEDRVTATGKVLPIKTKESVDNTVTLTWEETKKSEVKKERNRKAAKKSRDKKKEEFDNDLQIEREMCLRNDLLKKQIADLSLEEAWRQCVCNDMKLACSTEGHFFMTARPLNKDDRAAINLIQELQAIVAPKDKNSFEGAHSVPMELNALTSYSSQLVTSSSKYSANSNTPRNISFGSGVFNGCYANSNSSNLFYPAEEICTGTNKNNSTNKSIKYDRNRLNENAGDNCLAPMVKKVRIE
ncbi:unnamed protein product [Lymnaea stagnalis]|uniref:BZIP domain-containing protein n=1 Tax=Lymnaea stagnalis TaxID=6523 RepID=A0AAV2HYE5_LYMST